MREYESKRSDRETETEKHRKGIMVVSYLPAVPPMGHTQGIPPGKNTLGDSLQTSSVDG